MECPKCHFRRNDRDKECPRCGIIYEKYELLMKKKEENHNKDQEDTGQNQTEIQITPTTGQTNRFMTYLAGIILAIITAVLIIHQYNSKINKSIDTHNRITASSGAVPATQPEEFEPEPRDEFQDLSRQSEEPLSNFDLTNTTEGQGTGSSSKNMIEEACKAVVTIKTASGFGSGFFINEDGYIITNKHVSKMDENVRESLKDTRESIEKQIKEKEELLSNIESEMADKKEKVDEGNSWISENTDGRYYNKQELDEKVAEVKSRQAQVQKHAREYNSLMNQYNYEKAKINVLQQKYDQTTNQINTIAYNSSLTVYLVDGTKKSASIISNSYNYDMALLKIDGVKTPYIKPAATDELNIGDDLYAIGTPHDISLHHTVTSGILSGFRDGLIQTNAQISGGNSGGPLITDEGKVVGINTSKIVADGVEGIGFSIPIDAAVQEYSQYFY